MNTIESVCNAALDQIGYKRHIGSIWDGTTAARIALDVWGQTRDELFVALRPRWAVKDAALVVLRQAPTDFYQTTVWTTEYPPLPWNYSYSKPSDMLEPLQLKGRPLGLPVWRPRAVLWREATDTVTGDPCILSFMPDAIATYLSRVLDPLLWHDSFTAAMIERLVQKFASLTSRPPDANETRRPSQQSTG